MLITIGAMIGAGKTSLADLVANHFNSEVFYESVDDNPILPVFYTASEEEIQTKRYPFLLQLWFLNTRFKSIKEALIKENNILDELEELPKKSPDLMIYLSGSFETILERIKKRGREYELDEALVSYYYTLWEGYDNWIKQHYKASEVLIINIDEIDYVNNEEHKQKVLSMIEQKLEEIRKEK